MKIDKLKNKLSLVSADIKGTKTVTILILFAVGSKYENKNNSGVAHYLEHMMFKGTKKRPSPSIISNELDSLGAEFNAFTSKEYTGYWIKVEKSKVEKASNILSDITIESTINKPEMDRERGVIVEEFNMYQDNPMMHIEDVFENCLYGDTPAGRDTIGTKKTITEMTRKDLQDFFETYYSAENAILLFSGNLSGINTKNLAEKFFNKKKLNDRGKNYKKKDLVQENQGKPVVKIEYKKTDQAHLMLGVRASHYRAKDALITKMISVILGGSMSSRLFMNLREKNGLAYYVRTSLDSYTDSGYLVTQAGVSANDLKKAIKIILDEYKKIKTKLVDAKELRRVKDIISGRSAIQFEASDNLANWYGKQAVLLKEAGRLEEEGLVCVDAEIKTPDEYIKEVEKITARDIKRVANKIFITEKINLAVIGPFKNKVDLEKGLAL